MVENGIVEKKSGPPTFVVKWDLSHLGDDEFDAQLVKFPDWENATSLESTQPYRLPEKILFEGNFANLAKIDYPYNDVSWPIMHKRMLQVLRDVGDFPHREIPVAMLNDAVRSADRYRRDGTPNPNVEKRGFAAVQLTEHLDLVDWGQSDVERDEDIPSRIVDISKLILKEPASGYPPLFRLSAYPTALFASADARQALLDAGIQGVKFVKLENFRG